MVSCVDWTPPDPCSHPFVFSTLNKCHNNTAACIPQHLNPMASQKDKQTSNSSANSESHIISRDFFSAEFVSVDTVANSKEESEPINAPVNNLRKKAQRRLSDSLISCQLNNGSIDEISSSSAGRESTLNPTEKVYFGGCSLLSSANVEIQSPSQKPSFAFHYWPAVLINNVTRVSARASFANDTSPFVELEVPVENSETSATNSEHSTEDEASASLNEDLKSSCDNLLDKHDNGIECPMKLSEGPCVPSETPASSSTDDILTESVQNDLCQQPQLESTSLHSLPGKFKEDTALPLPSGTILYPTQPLDHNPKQSTNSILKSSRSRAGVKVLESNKSVHFADSTGRSLVQIQEFSASQELLDQIKKDSLQAETSFTVKENKEPLFKFDFVQPALNYLAFRAKLENNLISLENAYFYGARQFCGTVKVKNISFHKRVFMRITFNSWSSTSDIQCTYVNNGLDIVNVYDTFKFEVDIPPSWYTYHRIEFCVCYFVDGSEHWDNNGGKNYCIVANWPTLHVTDRPTSNPTLFSYWRANCLVDEDRPYW